MCAFDQARLNLTTQKIKARMIKDSILTENLSPLHSFDISAFFHHYLSSLQVQSLPRNFLEKVYLDTITAFEPRPKALSNDFKPNRSLLDSIKQSAKTANNNKIIKRDFIPYLQSRSLKHQSLANEAKQKENSTTVKKKPWMNSHKHLSQSRTKAKNKSKHHKPLILSQQSAILKQYRDLDPFQQFKPIGCISSQMQSASDKQPLKESIQDSQTNIKIQLTASLQVHQHYPSKRKAHLASIPTSIQHRSQSPKLKPRSDFQRVLQHKKNKQQISSQIILQPEMLSSRYQHKKEKQKNCQSYLKHWRRKAQKKYLNSALSDCGKWKIEGEKVVLLNEHLEWKNQIKN